MAGAGFTDDDRKRFERMDLHIEDVLKKIEELFQRFRDVEVDIDDLRASKAEKADLSLTTVHSHETRLQLVEAAHKAMEKELGAMQAEVKQMFESIKKDLEPLKAWRLKELGGIAVIVAMAEMLFHLVVKKG